MYLLKPKKTHIRIWAPSSKCQMSLVLHCRHCSRMTKEGRGSSSSMSHFIDTGCLLSSPQTSRFSKLVVIFLLFRVMSGFACTSDLARRSRSRTLGDLQWLSSNDCSGDFVKCRLAAPQGLTSINESSSSA